MRGRDRQNVLRQARCERGVYTAKVEREERTIRGNELKICRFHVSAQAGPAGVTPNHCESSRLTWAASTVEMGPAPA